MTQKIMADEAKHQEKYLLFENEYQVNREVTFTLRIIGAGIVPLIFLLKFLGFFLFTIEEGLIPLVTTGIILLIPSVFGAFSLYKKPWFKYIVVICVTLSIPNMYIEFDYMMLILWVMPILASCLYFNKRFNLMSLGFNIFVLGVTSYYRSSQRMMDGLITDRIGSLYKDFLVSFTTYTLLTIVMFLFISSITKKANKLLYEMIQFKHYEKISIVDALTGIYNYRYLLLTIEKNKAEYEKSGTPFSIIVFDADHFKYINDNYGHLVGDKALIQICNCLKEQIREGDVLGRYGGEEFIIVFPNTNSEQAYSIADRCREAVSKISVEGTKHRLSISGGIQEFKGGLISEMINQADMKMYYAKDAGRNKVETQHTQAFKII